MKQRPSVTGVPLISGKEQPLIPPVVETVNYRKYAFVLFILIGLVSAVVLSAIVLVYSNGLSSVMRFGISVDNFRGMLTMDSNNERAEYVFQYFGLSSNITLLQVKGPVSAGANSSTTVAFTLCGGLCSVCDLTSVLNQASGHRDNRCDDGTGLLNIFRTISQNPTRYYLQISTVVNPNGELFDYLDNIVGWSQ
jgi:hypothetical protein